MAFAITPSTPANQRLARALRRGNDAELRQALLLGASPTIHFDSHYCDALAYAQYRAPELVDTLLAAGATPCPPGSPAKMQQMVHTSAFVCRAARGTPAEVQDWLERFPGLHTPNYLLSALHNASESMLPVIIQAIQALNMDLSSNPDFHSGVRSWASHRPILYLDAALAIATNLAADVDLCSSLLCGSLAKRSQSAWTQRLLDMGACPYRTIYYREHSSDTTAFAVACEKGQLDWVQRFMAMKNPDIQDPEQAWLQNFTTALTARTSLKILTSIWSQGPAMTTRCALVNNARMNLPYGFPGPDLDVLSAVCRKYDTNQTLALLKQLYAWGVGTVSNATQALHALVTFNVQAPSPPHQEAATFLVEHGARLDVVLQTNSYHVPGPKITTEALCKEHSAAWGSWFSELEKKRLLASVAALRPATHRPRL